MTRPALLLLLTSGCSTAIPAGLTRDAEFIPPAPPSLPVALPAAAPRKSAPPSPQALLFEWQWTVRYEDNSLRSKKVGAGQEAVAMTPGIWHCVVSLPDYATRDDGLVDETRRLTCGDGTAIVSSPVSCFDARAGLEGATLFLARDNTAIDQRAQLVCGPLGSF